MSRILNGKLGDFWVESEIEGALWIIILMAINSAHLGYIESI